MRKATVFSRVVDFITESARKNGYEGLIPHFDRTVYWLQELDPHASEEQLVAAFAHDAERVTKSKEKQSIQKTGYQDPDSLRLHQQEGAKVVRDFLLSIDVSQSFANEVYRLISKHEEGGDEKQNLLMDADSVSFFENNIELFLKRAAVEGKKEVREKLQWMFDRIQSSKAQKIARPLFESAIKRLELLVD